MFKLRNFSGIAVLFFLVMMSLSGNAQSDTSGLEVEIDVYSGLSNPAFSIETQEQLDKVRELFDMAKKAGNTSETDVTDVGSLVMPVSTGYRGIIIQNPGGGVSDFPEYIAVYRGDMGIKDSGTNYLVLTYAERNLEDFLLNYALENGIIDENTFDTIMEDAFGKTGEEILRADINGDGRIGLEEAVYSLQIVSGVINNSPQGSVTSFSTCKVFSDASDANDSDDSPDKAYVEYQYDGTGTLLLRHVNAGFNCCPDKLSGDISVNNGVVLIQEKEIVETPCDCLCLYDMEFSITHLKPGNYTLRISEPYLNTDENEEIEFTLNLSSATEGSYGVDRSGYPWAIQDKARGTVLSFSECKFSERLSVNKSDNDDSVPSDRACMEYQYDGTGTLLLRHINAGFNCCPDTLSGDISIDDNKISIQEKEVAETPCHCLCLYDMEFEITNLNPGEYTIDVYEPYMGDENDKKITFELNLSSAVEGTYCVERSYYPWGF